MGTLTQILVVAAVVLALASLRVSFKVWTGAAAAALVFWTATDALNGFGALVAWLAFAAICIPFNVTSIRRDYITRHIFQGFKKVLPPMTATEREALEAGDVWWDGELFCGEPNWQKLLSMPKPQLTAEEQSFLDNETEELCAMLDDWKVVQEQRDMPKEVWQFIKEKRFFGMVISKDYGGLSFSAQAHSAVVAKIASRSLSAAVTVMVPNSLGPGELLHHYGTTEQKQRWLPGLASGQEIPCFALTGPDAGSDAGAIPDFGIVTKGEFEGKEIVGIKLNFSKRYITLAPVATCVGLAFKLYDPEGLLGEKKNIGITCALLPRDTQGMDIGKRHFPMNQAFMNGTIYGKDVFIPLDWIIGGEKMAGQGWRMLVECLSIGRSISLPALATASGKVAYRMTGAYARIRKQFKTSIGRFEGVEEAMAEIAGNAYMLEASRRMTADAVDQGVKPSVPSAIAKYHMTEMSRTSIDHALDVHAGRAVQIGPRNYLAHAYQGIPVAITVEGANILTRNLIIFGQGAVRCHPYVRQEMEAAADTDTSRGLTNFDKLLYSHINYGVSNFARSFFYALGGWRTIKSPVAGPTKKYYQQLTRMSTGLALVADISMLILGGELKRKERLSARLGDVLSKLYIASMVLKFYEDNGRQANELPYVDWCVTKCLYDIQVAFNEFFDNFSLKPVAAVLRRVVFPFGDSFKRPSDKMSHKVVTPMLEPNAVRDRITDGIFIGKDADDITGRMEVTLQKMMVAEPIDAKVQKALRKRQISGLLFDEVVNNAVAASIITEEEATILRDFEEARKDALATDEFTHEYLSSAMGLKPESSQSQVA